MRKPEDKYLTGLLAKDPTIIQAIYAEFAPRIESSILKKGGRKEDARDVFQEALLIIWRKAQSPEFVLTSSFYTFLYGVCLNLWRRKLKKKDNNAVTILEAKGLKDEENIEVELEIKERHRVFSEHFSAMDRDCQRLLRLFFEGKSMKQIADLLGIDNDHAARNRKYRCQKKLEDSILNDARYKELTSRT